MRDNFVKAALSTSTGHARMCLEISGRESIEIKKSFDKLSIDRRFDRNRINRASCRIGKGDEAIKIPRFKGDVQTFDKFKYKFDER